MREFDFTIIASAVILRNNHVWIGSAIDVVNTDIEQMLCVFAPRIFAGLQGAQMLVHSLRVVPNLAFLLASRLFLPPSGVLMREMEIDTEV